MRRDDMKRNEDHRAFEKREMSGDFSFVFKQRYFRTTSILPRRLTILLTNL
jgi:hypothetical protein